MKMRIVLGFEKFEQASDLAMQVGTPVESIKPIITAGKPSSWKVETSSSLAFVSSIHVVLYTPLKADEPIELKIGLGKDVLFCWFEAGF